MDTIYPPDTYALCAAVSGATIKSVSYGHPPRATVRNPDGDVRQDIDLLIARDTGAPRAQVSRVHDSPKCRVR